MKKIFCLFMILSVIANLSACYSTVFTNTTTLPQGTRFPATTAAPIAPSTDPSIPSSTPTVNPTCPPVDGDIYWGDFRGKGFKVETEEISSPVELIRLYSNGSCEFTISGFLSTIPSPTVWCFDGNYLYIGIVDAGKYSTFLYEGTEDPIESKLIFVKSDHDLNHFNRLQDGQIFMFAGIIRWETGN